MHKKTLIGKNIKKRYKYIRGVKIDK